MTDRVSNALRNSFRPYDNPIVFKIMLERLLNRRISNDSFKLQFDSSGQVFFERTVFITPSVITIGCETRRMVHLLNENDELLLPLFRTDSINVGSSRVLNVYGEFSSCNSNVKPSDSELEKWIDERIVEANGEITPISLRTIEKLNSVGIRTADIKLGSVLLEQQNTVLTNAHPLVFLNDRRYRDCNIVKSFDDGVIELRSSARKNDEDVGDRCLSIGMLACSSARFIDIDISDHVVVYNPLNGELFDLLFH